MLSSPVAGSLKVGLSVTSKTKSINMLDYCSSCTCACMRVLARSHARVCMCVCVCVCMHACVRYVFGCVCSRSEVSVVESGEGEAAFRCCWPAKWTRYGHRVGHYVHVTAYHCMSLYITACHCIEHPVKPYKAMADPGGIIR